MRTQQIIGIILILVSLVFFFYLSQSYKDESYDVGQGYNTYDREQIEQTLAMLDDKETNENVKMTLNEYVAILNSTSNLKTISLQELSGNPILGCDELENIDNTKDCLDFCKKVASEKMIECMKNQDWYRLSLIMLKIFQFLNHFGDKRSFERTPSNGVYGSESIRMLLNGESLTISEINSMPLFLSEKTIYDKECIRDVKKMLQCSEKSYEKSHSSTITVEMFCKLGWLLLAELF